MAYCIVAVLGVILASAQSNSVQHSRPESADERQYFPPGAFAPEDTSRDDAISHLLSGFLRSMNEPSLLDRVKTPGLVSYRIIWFHPFAKPAAVRLTMRSDGTGELVSNVLTSVNQKTDNIPVPKVDMFRQLVQRNDFWSMPASVAEPRIFDGAIWALEGVRDGSYHMVYRHEPSPGCFTQLGVYLSDLAKLDGASENAIDSRCPAK